MSGKNRQVRDRVRLGIGLRLESGSFFPGGVGGGFFPRIQNIITSDLKFKLIISRGSCPEVFCKKGVLRNFAKFTSQENTCARVSFLINLQADFIKKQTLTQVFFPLNLVKFLRTPFITEYFRWLLLNIQM